MKKLLLAAIAASFAVPAMAQQWHGGVSAGRTEQKLSVRDGGPGISDNSNGFKLYAGYQFTPSIGVELGYASLGEISISEGGAEASAKPRSVYGAVTGTVPLTPQLSLVGKLGAARTRTTVSASLEDWSDSARHSDNSLVVGIGATYAISDQVSLVAEYENFGKVAKGEGDSLKASMVSAGVRFKF